jgi:hypothetical protein
MGSLNAGRPIVLNGGSPYTRDLKGLASQVTGMQGEKSRFRLIQQLTAPFRSVMDRMAKRRGGK